MFNAKARNIAKLEKSQNRLIVSASEKRKKYEGERPGKIHSLLDKEMEKLTQMRETLRTLQVPENKGLMRKGEVPKALSTSFRDKSTKTMTMITSPGTGVMSAATSAAIGGDALSIAIGGAGGALAGAAGPYAIREAANLKRRFTETGRTNARIRKVINADGKGMTKTQMKEMSRKLEEVIAAKEAMVKSMQAELNTYKRKPRR